MVYWVDLGMNQSKEKENIHQYMAIELNVQTWNLLGKKDRNENDDKRMLFFAKASLHHWRKSPDYKPVNEQRGEWLISYVFAVLNLGDESLRHAKTCMDITMKKCFLNAKDSGEKIIRDEDRKLFFDDLHKGPWFECMGD